MGGGSSRQSLPDRAQVPAIVQRLLQESLEAQAQTQSYNLELKKLEHARQLAVEAATAQLAQLAHDQQRYVKIAKYKQDRNDNIMRTMKSLVRYVALALIVYKVVKWFFANYMDFLAHWKEQRRRNLQEATEQREHAIRMRGMAMECPQILAIEYERECRVRQMDHQKEIEMNKLEVLDKHLQNRWRRADPQMLKDVGLVTASSRQQSTMTDSDGFVQQRRTELPLVQAAPSGLGRDDPDDFRSEEHRSDADWYHASHSDIGVAGMAPCME
mmetsp:Transcript_170835/g.542839  ORF Transcript_170835/g.542839 Transcript_170835/m.542839 type:complete len:271 (-) Transcript_170835:184-996(-)